MDVILLKMSAVIAPKVLTPILVPAATFTEEEKEDSSPRTMNGSLNTPGQVQPFHLQIQLQNQVKQEWQRQ